MSDTTETTEIYLEYEFEEKYLGLPKYKLHVIQDSINILTEKLQFMNSHGKIDQRQRNIKARTKNQYKMYKKKLKENRLDNQLKLLAKQKMSDDAFPLELEIVKTKS